MMFQDDDVRWHRARIVDAFLQQILLRLNLQSNQDKAEYLREIYYNKLGHLLFSSFFFSGASQVMSLVCWLSKTKMIQQHNDTDVHPALMKSRYHSF